MSAKDAKAREQDEAAEVLSWLADQMCRLEEPLAGSFSNSLSVAGLARLRAMMATAEFRGSRCPYNDTDAPALPDDHGETDACPVCGDLGTADNGGKPRARPRADALSPSPARTAGER